MPSRVLYLFILGGSSACRVQLWRSVGRRADVTPPLYNRNGIWTGVVSYRRWADIPTSTSPSSPTTSSNVVSRARAHAHILAFAFACLPCSLLLLACLMALLSSLIWHGDNLFIPGPLPCPGMCLVLNFFLHCLHCMAPFLHSFCWHFPVFGMCMACFACMAFCTRHACCLHGMAWHGMAWAALGMAWLPRSWLPGLEGQDKIIVAVYLLSCHHQALYAPFAFYPPPWVLSIFLSW